MNPSRWRPSAAAGALPLRARLLRRTREFFLARDVMEVETPIAVSRTVTDPQIESLRLAGESAPYLHTSPEYAMKRLLAAGAGDIYQVCKVFRAGERGKLHNPEFTLVEWYRRSLTLDGIMDETAALAAVLLDGCWPHAAAPVEKLSYQQAFLQELRIDPLEASLPELAAICAQHGLSAQSIEPASRDLLLDFLVATQIGPRLGRGHLACLHHYPASQASLARIDPTDPRTALRFELYAEGVELANGFVELADAGEQRRRFEADRDERRRRGASMPEADERLLAALESGLPPCAGVALGFDRLVMLAAGAASIDAVLAFPWEDA